MASQVHFLLPRWIDFWGDQFTPAVRVFADKLLSSGSTNGGFTPVIAFSNRTTFLLERQSN